VLVNQADDERWIEAFPSLEVVRYFSCTIGEVNTNNPHRYPDGTWEGGVGPTLLLGAPTVVLYATISERGFKFLLPTGVKQVVVSLGKPQPRLRYLGLGVSNPFYDGHPPLPRLPNPGRLPGRLLSVRWLPDTVERITIVHRDEDLTAHALCPGQSLWQSVVKARAFHSLLRGEGLTLVGDLSVLPSPHELCHYAKGPVERTPAFAYRLGREQYFTVKDFEARWAQRPNPADLRPIEERMRVMSEEEWRAEAGERVYRLAMDSMHTEI
jgi:hypothetical protein